MSTYVCKGNPRICWKSSLCMVMMARSHAWLKGLRAVLPLPPSPNTEKLLTAAAIRGVFTLLPRGALTIHLLFGLQTLAEAHVKSKKKSWYMWNCGGEVAHWYCSTPGYATSTVPLPMRYTTMGYTSMRYTSMSSTKRIHKPLTNSFRNTLNKNM